MISKEDLNDAQMDTLTKSLSNDSHNRQWRSADAWRVQFMYKKWDILDDGSPRGYAEHGYSYEWINGQKPRLIQKGFRIWCNTENFFPIVFLGLSTSSSSSFPSSSVTRSRQESIIHPTICPKLVYFTNHNCLKRQWDWSTGRLEWDRFLPSVCDQWTRLPSQPKNPKPNDGDHDLERGDPLCSDIPEWLQEFRENLVDDRVPEHRNSHASSCHEPSLEPTPARSVVLGKQCVYPFLQRRKLRDLPEDQNYKGPV